MKRSNYVFKVFLIVFILVICLCSCKENNEILKENNYSSEIIYESQCTSSENEYQSKTVYITPTGKRYHLSSTCGGKNSTPASLADAIQIYNLTPCKKCAQ